MLFILKVKIFKVFKKIIDKSKIEYLISIDREEKLWLIILVIYLLS